MEADFAPGPTWRRGKEGLQLSVDVAQHEIVHEELAVDPCQSLEDVGPAHELSAHADEGPHDIDALLCSLGAVDDVGRLQRPMFGKGKGEIFPMLAASGL